MTITHEMALQFEVVGTIMGLKFYLHISNFPQLNVGCGGVYSVLDSPIRLEYSLDGGSEWKLVVDDEHIKQNPYERTPVQTPTVFYSSTTGQWSRETVALAHIETAK